MTADHVNVTTFVRAETARMFTALLAESGAMNRWAHTAAPTSVDHQPVIRMNRDTLYSSALVDVSGGATVTLPDAGSRYVSVMVINEDHHINRILHEPGEHRLTAEEYGSDVVAVVARVLVDPGDPADVAAVNALQEQFGLTAASSTPYAPPDYDTASLDATRAALLQLAAGLPGFTGAFGSRDEVDPVLHLLGTAAGWGGLPEREAYYLNVHPGLPVGDYALRVEEVPVDGFWSISLYNAEGYFEPNPQGAYSVNNLTAVPDADGAVTVTFSGACDGRPNCLPIMEGWNFVVRMYRPRPEVLDGSWSFPTVSPR